MDVLLFSCHTLERFFQALFFSFKLKRCSYSNLLFGRYFANVSHHLKRFPKKTILLPCTYTGEIYCKFPAGKRCQTTGWSCNSALLTWPQGMENWPNHFLFSLLCPQEWETNQHLVPTENISDVYSSVPFVKITLHSCPSVVFSVQLHSPFFSAPSAMISFNPIVSGHVVRLPFCTRICSTSNESVQTNLCNVEGSRLLC